MDKVIKVSICIPTYNRCAVLQQCVQNLLNYSGGLDIEIIVSDNNSTDETKEICKAFLEDRRFLYYFNEENIGYENIYQVVTYATGDYVVLLSDEDDLNFVILEDLIEKMENNKNIGVVISSIENKIKGKSINYVDALFHGDDTAKVYMGYAGGYMSGIIYRSNILQEVIRGYIEAILANKCLYWEYVPHKALMVLLDGKCDFMLSSQVLVTVRTVEKIDPSIRDRIYGSMDCIESRLQYMEGNIQIYQQLERTESKTKEAMKCLYVRTLKRIIEVMDFHISNYNPDKENITLQEDLKIMVSKGFCQSVIERINKIASVDLSISEFGEEQINLDAEILRISNWRRDYIGE